ncbi:hypothetical protein D910_07518 [Dendroctonus ponderosae]|uniref:Reverse transcriptase domain-containing protein n=1 Tax=Dendroctonus ponderosae TaxID=77166 RepID=U4U8B9_DENPD|nr:hypothetical protein D910_07518 [Dendroctonus ponderosae]
MLSIRHRGEERVYLRKIILSYLENRKIITCYGEEVLVSCGVPQGSVLGPKLWNLVYNKILRIKTEEGAMLIAYADDLGLNRVYEMGLTVEPSKTQIVAVRSKTSRSMWMDASVRNIMHIGQVARMKCGVRVAEENVAELLLRSEAAGWRCSETTGSVAGLILFHPPEPPPAVPGEVLERGNNEAGAEDVVKQALFSNSI